MKLVRGNLNSTSSSDDDNTLNQEKLDDNIIQSLPSSPKKRDFDNSNAIKEKKIHRTRSKSDARSPRNQSRHIVSKKRRPTQCDCLKKGEHYEHISIDTKFTGSVEKIFNLLFTSEFLKRYLTEEEKCTGMKLYITLCFDAQILNYFIKKISKLENGILKIVNGQGRTVI
jgi:hypothetical protein